MMFRCQGGGGGREARKKKKLTNHQGGITQCPCHWCADMQQHGDCDDEGEGGNVTLLALIIMTDVIAAPTSFIFSFFSPPW